MTEGARKGSRNEARVVARTWSCRHWPVRKDSRTRIVHNRPVLALNSLSSSLALELRADSCSSQLSLMRSLRQCQFPLITQLREIRVVNDNSIPFIHSSIQSSEGSKIHESPLVQDHSHPLKDNIDTPAATVGFGGTISLVAHCVSTTQP